MRKEREADMNAKLRDCSLFRLLLFVIVPVAFLAVCAT